MSSMHKANSSNLIFRFLLQMLIYALFSKLQFLSLATTAFIPRLSKVWIVSSFYFWSLHKEYFPVKQRSIAEARF